MNRRCAEGNSGIAAEMKRPINQSMTQRAGRRLAALAFLALGGGTGCFLSSPAPGPSAPGPRCGDGVCASPESATSCPGDCAPIVVCGDGVCAFPESATSCPCDCAPIVVCGDGVCGPGGACASCATDCAAACLATCQAVDVASTLPLTLRDVTSSTAAGADQASCGDGAVGPLRHYRLTALPPGRYRVSATATFDIVVDVRDFDCTGGELTCEVASRGTVATSVFDLASHHSVIVDVAGLGGGAGDFTVDLAPEPRGGDVI